MYAIRYNTLMLAILAFTTHSASDTCYVAGLAGTLSNVALMIQRRAPNLRGCLKRYLSDFAYKECNLELLYNNATNVAYFSRTRLDIGDYGVNYLLSPDTYCTLTPQDPYPPWDIDELREINESKAHLGAVLVRRFALRYPLSPDELESAAQSLIKSVVLQKICKDGNVYVISVDGINFYTEYTPASVVSILTELAIPLTFYEYGENPDNLNILDIIFQKHCDKFSYWSNKCEYADLGTLYRFICQKLTEGIFTSGFFVVHEQDAFPNIHVPKTNSTTNVRESGVPILPTLALGRNWIRSIRPPNSRCRTLL